MKVSDYLSKFHCIYEQIKKFTDKHSAFLFEKEIMFSSLTACSTDDIYSKILNLKEDHDVLKYAVYVSCKYDYIFYGISITYELKMKDIGECIILKYDIVQPSTNSTKGEILNFLRNINKSIAIILLSNAIKTDRLFSLYVGDLSLVIIDLKSYDHNYLLSNILMIYKFDHSLLYNYFELLFRVSNNKFNFDKIIEELSQTDGALCSYVLSILNEIGCDSSSSDNIIL